MFQFHDGAIDSNEISKEDAAAMLFQFHDGAIDRFWRVDTL